MPTISEQVAATNAKLDSLLTTPTVTPVETTVELPPANAVVRIAEELAKGEVTKARAEYLSTVLAEIAKVNSEGTNTSISIKIVNDPTQIKPSTESIAGIASLTTLKPDNGFSSNISSVLHKMQLIQKLLNDREALRKGKVSDKLDDIIRIFGLTDDDLQSECELSWKVGDLVRQLQSAARIENLVEKSGSKDDDATPPVAAVWPADMADAKYDPVEKGYEKTELPWGHDTASRR